MGPVTGLVSVIIPTSNRAGLLRETLDSVMAQTHPQMEAVVVDDGSTDDTAAVVDGYVKRFGPERVRYFRQEPSGGQRARNLGMGQARGEYVNFLDDDDLLSADKLSAQMGVARQTGADVVYGRSVDFLAEGGGRTLLQTRNAAPFPAAPGGHFESWLRGWRWYLMSAIVRAEFLCGVGTWDERLCRYQDLEYIARLLGRSPRMAHSAEGTMFRRLHTGAGPKRTPAQLSDSFGLFLSAVESHAARAPGWPEPLRPALAVFMANWAVNMYAEGSPALARQAEQRVLVHDPGFRLAHRRPGARVLYALGGLRLVGFAARLRGRLARRRESSI